MERIKARLATVALAAMVMAMAAVPAFAQEGGVESLNDGFSDVVGDLTSVVTSNIPVIMGLLALTIGLGFVIKLARRHAKP